MITESYDSGMLTDQDIKNLKAGLVIKEDLEPLAKATDLANLEEKVDGISERVNKIPTAEELPILIARAIDNSSLKEEQEKIKQVLRDKLHVEI